MHGSVFAGSGGYRGYLGGVLAAVLVLTAPAAIAQDRVIVGEHFVKVEKAVSGGGVRTDFARTNGLIRTAPGVTDLVLKNGTYQVPNSGRAANLLKTVCRVRQACLVALGIGVVGAAIGFYYRDQDWPPPDTTVADVTGRLPCTVTTQTVGGYPRQVYQVPCAMGTLARPTFRDPGLAQTHNYLDPQGWRFTHWSWWTTTSVALGSTATSLNTQRACETNNCSITNRNNGSNTQTEAAAEYLDTTEIAESDAVDAFWASQGVTGIVGYTKTGVPVLGPLWDFSNVPDTELLTPEELVEHGLDTDDPLLPEPEPEPGTGGAEAVCGASPLPPCQVTVTNWPEAPPPDYVVDDDLDDDERSVGLDFGTGWLPSGCPAPVSIPTPYGSPEFAFDQACDVIEDIISPLVIVSALLAGLAIVFGSATRGTA